jgi:plastocyanin
MYALRTWRFSVIAAFLFFVAMPSLSYAQQVSVDIMDNSFSPKEISVVPGTTVFWTNHGSAQHTVTLDNGAFDSGAIQPGMQVSFTFSTAGTYKYYCRFHGGPGGQGMSGVINVRTSSSSGSSTSTATSTSSGTTGAVILYATSTHQGSSTASTYPTQPYPPQQNYPAPPNTGGQPYVGLQAVPYTGFDLGPFGDALYASLILLFLSCFGYLVYYYGRALYKMK